MVNQIFTIAIIGVAILGAAIEISAIATYRISRCGATARAIEYLKQHLKQQQTTESPVILQRQEIEDDIFRWLIRHLDNKIIENTISLRQEGGSFVLLSYPSVLQKPTPRSPIYFAPTLLTALGVLGTFAGIYLGLQGVSLDAIADTNSLLATSTQLLSGMKVAFSTSLWGLSAASFFILFLAFGERSRQWRRDSLRKQLNRIAFLESPYRLLSRWQNQTSKNVDIAGLTPEAIGQATGQQVASALMPVLGSISQDLKDIRELHKDGVQKISRELIAPVVVELEQSAKLSEETSQAVKELKEAIAASLLTISRFQEETLGNLQELALQLQQILEQFQSETRQVMQAAAAQIQETLEQSGKHQQQTLEEVRQQTQQILDDANQAFIAQSDSIVQLGNEASALMEQAKDSLTGSLENIHAMLENSSEIVREELEKFRLEYQDSLQTFFSEQNNLLEHLLGRQREGLAAAIDSFKQALQEETERHS